MVPPGFPNPEAMVTLTGILEFAGVLGLLVPAMRAAAAVDLVALLVAMFSANVHAARTGLTLRGKPIAPVVPRIAIQAVFIAAVALARLVRTIENGRLVNDRQVRLTAIFKALLKARFAHVDPVLTHQAVSARIMDGAADNLILHAITNDASAGPASDMAFFTLDVSDFGAAASALTSAAANVRLLADSQTVVAWLKTP